MAIGTLLATIIGILSGYYEGRIDTVLKRCIDTLMAFPGFVVLLTIMAMLGQGERSQHERPPAAAAPSLDRLNVT